MERDFGAGDGQSKALSTPITHNLNSHSEGFFAMAKRPPLSGSAISARAVPKPTVGTDEVSTPAARPRPSTSRDLKTVMARINRDGWREIHSLGLELDMPLQAIIVEALNDFLQKHNKPPVVETRQPDKPTP